MCYKLLQNDRRRVGNWKDEIEDVNVSSVRLVSILLCLDLGGLYFYLTLILTNSFCRYLDLLASVLLGATLKRLS